jgi:hypothetical protein
VFEVDLDGLLLDRDVIPGLAGRQLVAIGDDEYASALTLFGVQTG